MRTLNHPRLALVRPIAVPLALAALAAPGCGEDKVKSDDPEVQSQIEEGERRGDEVNDDIEVELGDEEDDVALVIRKTVAIGATLNDGEITTSGIALDRSVSDDIRGLANMLIADHSAINTEALARLRERDLEALDTPVSERLRGEVATAAESLGAVPEEDFDRAFLDLQLILHGQARQIIGDFDDRTRDPDMDDFWRDTRDTIDAHLERVVELSEASRSMVE